jgi:hypothetical protein
VPRGPADRGDKEALPRLTVRLVTGDVVAERSAVVVVSHLSGLPPSGAEAALDAALGGMISRRAVAGALDTPFGSLHFLPVPSAQVATEAVVIVALGPPAEFRADRLAEVGAATAEAASTLGVRDATTVVHGTGSMGVDTDEAAFLLMIGMLRARSLVVGGARFRELTIVERNGRKIGAIARGVRRAAEEVGHEVDLQRIPGRVGGRPRPAWPANGEEVDLGLPTIPSQLHLSITRAGDGLKVVFAGHEGLESTSSSDYPSEFADASYRRLLKEVLEQANSGKRLAAMRGLGCELYTHFLHSEAFDAAELIGSAPGACLVLSLDDDTVNLPWELLATRRGFLLDGKLVARALQLSARGHAGAFVDPHERARVLVVGDPTGDLPGARAEAKAVAEQLGRAGAEVAELIGSVSYNDVSTELNTTSFDILHYAGHAEFVSQHEERSGLVLSDGTLTADDLAARPLLPRFIFANACNAAQTEDVSPSLFAGARETRNMVSGVLAGGARAFLGSNWKVEDEAAKLFALAFYAAILGREGHGRRVAVGAAVQAARARLVDELGQAHPAWAGYSLYGSPWNPIL